MRRHRAAMHGAFLTPLLAPGMRVLDSGCRPGSITLDLAHFVCPGETAGADQESSQFQAAGEIGRRRSACAFLRARECQRANGGGPEAGRKPGTLLREAGFIDVRMTATYEENEPAALDRCSPGSPPRGAPLPAAAAKQFYAQPWCEAVGKAPAT